MFFFFIFHRFNFFIYVATPLISILFQKVVLVHAMCQFLSDWFLAWFLCCDEVLYIKRWFFAHYFSWKIPLKLANLFAATNGTTSPSRHFGSSFGHRADYEPVGGGSSEAATNGARYSNTTGNHGSNEMYDIPVGTCNPDLAIDELFLMRPLSAYNYY